MHHLWITIIAVHVWHSTEALEKGNAHRLYRGNLRDHLRPSLWCADVDNAAVSLRVAILLARLGCR